MNSLGQTYGGLTVAQLDRAVNDLRNAGLVVEHAGHYKGAIVDCHTGGACLVGAIELATYKKLDRVSIHDSDELAYYALPIPADDDKDAYRSEAAIVALADFVPTGLCYDCADEGRTCSCGSVLCEAPPREPWEIVTHYNDEHCRGGVMAVNVLNLAADETELRANVRRQHVANLLAAVP